MSKRKWLRRILKVCLVLTLLCTAALLTILYYTTPVTQHLDSFVYELPFKPGDRHRVVQGYGGLFSHRHIAALDFDMPVGTAVHAARGGTIYAYRDNNDEGGPFGKYKRKANYIIIRHDDGSFGCYWHLQKDGVLVKSGTVVKGQQIGISGATGQVIRPHLHFSVKLKLNYNEDSFTRTIFRTAEGNRLLNNRGSYQRPVD